MKMKRTITIEFDRVKVTTAHDHKHLSWCELCRAETEFLNSTEAAEVSRAMRMQGLDVFRENLHFYQPDEEQILVCLNSILNGDRPNIY